MVSLLRLELVMLFAVAPLSLCATEKQDDPHDSFPHSRRSKWNLPPFSSRLKRDLSPDANRLNKRDLASDANRLNKRDLSHDADRLNKRELSPDVNRLKERDLSPDVNHLNERDLSADADCLNERDLSPDADPWNERDLSPDLNPLNKGDLSTDAFAPSDRRGAAGRVEPRGALSPSSSSSSEAFSVRAQDADPAERQQSHAGLPQSRRRRIYALLPAGFSGQTVGSLEDVWKVVRERESELQTFPRELESQNELMDKTDRKITDKEVDQNDVARSKLDHYETSIQMKDLENKIQDYVRLATNPRSPPAETEATAKCQEQRGTIQDRGGSSRGSVSGDCHRDLGTCYFDQLYKADVDVTGRILCSALRTECAVSKLSACVGQSDVQLPCSNLPSYITITKDQLLCLPNFYECFFSGTNSTEEGCRL